MSMFSRWFNWLPSPMKRLRQYLHIEQEWQEFKHHIRPHQYKIYLGIVLVTYPLYSSYLYRLKDWGSYQVAKAANSFLAVDNSAFQITDNLYSCYQLVLKIY